MPRIVTLTMNPAVDLSTSVERIEPVRKLRCGEERRDPGGGGINVARVMSRFGGDVTAVYPIGGVIGQLLKQLVDAEGVKSATVSIAGETREDFTVLEQATDQQYRFVLAGPHLQEAEWRDCLKVLAALGSGADFVCISGSLPPGAPVDFYGLAAQTLAGGGAKLALDASGVALRSALEHPVHVVKPNLRELHELVGPGPDDPASLVKTCRALIAGSRVEVVALTLGAEGALLVTADRAWRAAALPITPVSTVGAGDSFLGAMIWALASGMTLEESFRFGVAGGSAALLSPGTELCRPADVRRLLSQVTIEAVGA